jgi:hypothetical protein
VGLTLFLRPHIRHYCTCGFSKKSKRTKEELIDEVATSKNMPR